MDCITAARGAIVKAFGLPRSYNTSLEYIQLIISILIKIKTINYYYYYLYPKSDQHLTSNNNINGITKYTGDDNNNININNKARDDHQR